MCKMTKTDLTLQHSFVGEHKLTPSRQQTLSALHLIARQSTRFEVSFNLEPIYYSDLKRTMPKRRTQSSSLQNCFESASKSALRKSNST